MGDDLLTEDDMLAHAIALSLAGQEAAGTPGVNTAPMTSSSPRAASIDLDQPEVPARSNTTQSCDSLLNEGEDSLCGSLTTWQKQTSRQELTESLRSSPDLGIAAESDVDPQGGMDGEEGGNPQSGITRGEANLQAGRGAEGGGGRVRKDDKKDDRDSSPEVERINPSNMQNITLDGQRNTAVKTDTRINPVGAESHHLPYTRLSSLHNMNLGSGKTMATWTPNKDALDLIVAMGISVNAAKRALYNTGNKNAQLAVSWVFDNIEDTKLHDPFDPPSISPEGGGLGSGGHVYLSYDEVVQGVTDFNREEAYKMTLVVNTELKMGVGKTAAQVGHAVLGLFHFLEDWHDQKQGLREWENMGAKKIVVKGKDAVHLMELKQKADEVHVASIMVQDAGRTQVEPGSLTVLALFGKNKNVDLVSGNLKLL